MKLRLRVVGAGLAFFSFPLLVAACGGGEEELPFGLKSEVVTPADHASNIVFAPDGRIFFGEQFTGNIRVINANGQLQPDPFAHLDVANYLDLDWGLTGLALHPDFKTNHYVYAFYTKPVQAPAAFPRLQIQSADNSGAQAPAQATSVPGPLNPAGQTPQPTPSPQVTSAPATAPQPTEPKPRGQPVLVRWTDANGKGEDETVVSDNFPVTAQEHPGYNANGRIHFGPDHMLYLSIGDYDFKPAESQSQNLSSPVGKLLKIDPDTGGAAPNNPFAGQANADPRTYAYGFREHFDFTFHPQTGAIYGTDNTPDTCEELNIIKPGGNYGWPDVGEFPYANCDAGSQVRAIYHFAREGTQPGDFLSFVEVSGLVFVPAARYPTLGDSLFVCESQRAVVGGAQSPGVLRRLVLAGAAFDQVTASDVIVKDCKGHVGAAPDGTVYYANDREIRRLVPGASGGAPSLAPPSG